MLQMLICQFILTYLSPEFPNVAASISLNAVGTEDPVVHTLNRICGKLLLYTSSIDNSDKRFRSISEAASRIADLLQLPMEVVSVEKEMSPIYVYYKSGDDEPIPIYWDGQDSPKRQDVFKKLKNMIFVLSFHPRHSALKPIRRKLMQFS